MKLCLISAIEGRENCRIDKPMYLPEVNGALVLKSGVKCEPQSHVVYRSICLVVVESELLHFP